MAVRGPLVALTARSPMASRTDWAAVDPDSDMRILLAGGSLRRRLRPAVLETQRRATGRVLEIGGPLAGGFAYESPGELVVAPASSVGEPAREPFDTVCSFGALSAAPSLDSLVATLGGLLTDGGRLLFVELDGDARRRRPLDRLARRMWGMAMSRDISGALWAGGFEVISLDRRPLGYRGLLRVVVGVARPDVRRCG